MSLIGWLLLTCGVVAVVGFIAGLVSGETIFLFPAKHSGAIATAAYADEPILYLVFMVANVVAIVCIWGFFYSWLRERKRRGLTLRRKATRNLIQ